MGLNPQVLYHMFEAYVEMGAENVGATEVAKGFASFAVVAIGGTIIGISKSTPRCANVSLRGCAKLMPVARRESP